MIFHRRKTYSYIKTKEYRYSATWATWSNIISHSFVYRLPLDVNLYVLFSNGNPHFHSLNSHSLVVLVAIHNIFIIHFAPDLRIVQSYDNVFSMARIHTSWTYLKRTTTYKLASEYFQIRSFRHYFKSSCVVFYVLSSVAIAVRVLSGVKKISIANLSNT